MEGSDDELNMAAAPVLDRCASWIRELAQRKGMVEMFLRELLERGEADMLVEELKVKDLRFVADRLTQTFRRQCSQKGRKQDIAERIVDYIAELREAQGGEQRFQMAGARTINSHDLDSDGHDVALQQALTASARAATQIPDHGGGAASQGQVSGGLRVQQMPPMAAAMPPMANPALFAVGIPNALPGMPGLQAPQVVSAHAAPVVHVNQMYAMQMLPQLLSQMQAAANPAANPAANQAANLAAGAAQATEHGSSGPSDAAKPAVKSEKREPAIQVAPWEAPAVQLLREMSFSLRDAIKGLRNTGFKQGDDPESAADVAMTWLVSRIEQMDESRKQDAVALLSEKDKELEWARRREADAKLVDGKETGDRCILGSKRFEESVLLAGPKLPEKTGNGCRIRGSTRLKGAAQVMEYLDDAFVMAARRRLVALVLLEQKCIKWFGDPAICYLCRCSDEVDSKGGPLAALDATTLDLESAKAFGNEAEWLRLEKDLESLLERLQSIVYLTGGGCPDAFSEAYRLESAFAPLDSGDVEMVHAQRKKDGEALILLSSDDEEEEEQEEEEQEEEEEGNEEEDDEEEEDEEDDDEEDDDEEEVDEEDDDEEEDAEEEEEEELLCKKMASARKSDAPAPKAAKTGSSDAQLCAANAPSADGPTRSLRKVSWEETAADSSAGRASGRSCRQQGRGNAGFRGAYPPANQKRKAAAPQIEESRKSASAKRAKPSERRQRPAEEDVIVIVDSSDEGD